MAPRFPRTYVPVTLGIKELPEILRFLAEAPEGQAIAKGIAEAGSNWVGIAWRIVDMRLATFRILLEYARLYGEERDRTGECPWNRLRGRNRTPQKRRFLDGYCNRSRIGYLLRPDSTSFKRSWLSLSLTSYLWFGGGALLVRVALPSRSNSSEISRAALTITL